MTNPIFIPAPFARDSAYKNTIQKTRQSGQDQEDMTWTGGAPLITMTPKDNGGLAPKGQDFNGVLNATTENTVFVQNGGRYKWSSDVITNYGGYAKDAIVQSDNGVSEFISLVDNNTVNPNSTLGTSWAVYAGQGSVSVASSTIAGVTKVLNNLDSTDTGSALSAAQGKVLNDNKVAISSIVNNLTSTATNQPLSAAQGKVLNDALNNGNQSANGYQWIGKTLIQWGIFTSTNTQSDLVFPLAFPNALLSITGNLNSNTPDVIGIDFNLSTATRTSIKTGAAQVGASWLGGKKISWIAIGY